MKGRKGLEGSSHGYTCRREGAILVAASHGLAWRNCKEKEEGGEWADLHRSSWSILVFPSPLLTYFHYFFFFFFYLHLHNKQCQSTFLTHFIIILITCQFFFENIRACMHAWIHFFAALSLLLLHSLSFFFFL